MKKINQVDINVGAEELENLTKSINDRWLSEGPFCAEFIEKIKQTTGSKYVLFAPNATLGMFMAFYAMNLPKGSEVLVPNFTFYASATPIVFAGLKPVFVDVDPNTFHMDLDLAEKSITENTSAILPVHMYGQCMDMDAVMALAKKHNLKVIEDAAQAMGVEYNGKHAGTFGDVGAFSMYSDKTIFTGEGGIVLTQSEELYEKMKSIRNHGRPNQGTFIHDDIGMNFRITDMQAGVGLAQINKLPTIISEKKRKYDLYIDNLQGVGDLKFMQVEQKSTFAPFRFTIQTSHRDELSETLESAGIQARPFFYPMHKQPPLQQYANGNFPVSEKLYETGICLPVHFDISDDDVVYICDVIKEFFNK